MIAAHAKAYSDGGGGLWWVRGGGGGVRVADVVTGLTSSMVVDMCLKATTKLEAPSK